MKKDEFTELLVRAQITPEVKADSDLLSIINAALADLKKDEPINLVATKMSASLANHLLSHHLYAPQTILDVQKVATKEANKYRGIAYTSMLWGR